MISNFTAARRAIYSQRSASRSDTRAWRGADVGFPLPSCLPIGRMRCEPSAAGLGTSRWMCVLGAQRPLAAVAHVASEWPPDGRPRRRDGSFCGAGMPRAYVGRGWCSGRDRTVAYTSYNAHLRGCPRLPGARVCPPRERDCGFFATLISPAQSESAYRTSSRMRRLSTRDGIVQLCE